MSITKVKLALKALHEFGLQNGQRITEPRALVLGIVVSGAKPLTAYEVLEALGKKIENPKPPTAYRALDFLAQNGFVHRIESLNAYVACGENHKHNGSQFMICNSCGQVEEVHLCSVPEGLQNQLDKQGFSLSHWNAELHGICKKCK